MGNYGRYSLNGMAYSLSVCVCVYECVRVCTVCKLEGGKVVVVGRGGLVLYFVWPRLKRGSLSQRSLCLFFFSLCTVSSDSCIALDSPMSASVATLADFIPAAAVIDDEPMATVDVDWADESTRIDSTRRWILAGNKWRRTGKDFRKEGRREQRGGADERRCKRRLMKGVDQKRRILTLSISRHNPRRLFTRQCQVATT